MNSNTKGKLGEDRAVLYLEESGYDILERRFRSARGEVDIIARKGENLVFVEVKTWDVLPADSLELSVNARKRGRIRHGASYFLLCHPELAACRLRFDLIFLSRRMKKLDHWESAF